MLQLRQQDRHTLQATLARFPEVQQAWVFGSRATGHARRASDIDLALDAPDVSPARWHALLDALQHAPIIYTLDVVHLNTLDDATLKQSILRDRIAL
jgi:predicted nucleotidyltransferase